MCFNWSVSQEQKILDSLITISNNQEKLDYLATVIPTQLYSNPDDAAYYTKVYDSIAKLEITIENRANALNFKGMSNYVSHNYENAITFYLEAIKLLETQESGQKLSRVYNNLAACYNVRNDFENTEKYFLKSLEIASTLNDEPWVANINNNLSILYMQNEMYDKAEDAIDNALEYFEEKNDSLMMGIAYMNYGNSKLFNENFESSTSYYKKSLEHVKLDQVPLVHAVAQTGIGIGLTKKGNYEKALPYLKKGVEISEAIKHDEQLMESYNALADYYSLTNRYKDAYEISQLSKGLKDSILTREQDQSMANALAKFESDKKDAQLKLLNVEAEKKEQQKKLYLTLALSGLAFASLLGYFAYRNRKQKLVLAGQKKELEITVEEKNILFKEVHHRVKNSLQMVSSLLFLQSENVDHSEAKNAIKVAQNRVRSLSLIHQKLYSKKHLVGIETEDYFIDLTNDIFSSHQLESQNLDYELDIENIVLNVDTITPIGLILNELIVNVLKHAFKQNHPENKLHIKFYKEENKLVLKVIDNGIGYTQENLRKNAFGLKLINSLARKLDATFNIEAIEPTGTKATLLINDFEIVNEK
jgi:two-component sensor histidine kinase